MRFLIVALAALLVSAPVLAEQAPHGTPTYVDEYETLGEGSLVNQHDAHATAESHEAEHGESSGGLPQFDPTWFASQIFWLAVAFAVLLVFFSRRTLPDISSTIENRRNHIQSDLEMAEKLQAEAEAVRIAYESSLETAHANATQAVTDVEHVIKAKAAKEYEAFQKRAEKEVADIEKRLSQAKMQAMNNMNEIAAEVAADAVEKITGVKTDLAKAKAIVESLTGKARAA